VSYFDFGSANTIIAMIVATMKASLVAAFFMHLTHDKLFNTVCLLAAFLFLGIFFLFTYEDTSSRARVDEANGSEVLATNGEAAPGGMPQVVVKKSGDHGAAGTGNPTSPAEKASEGHGAPKAAGSAVGGGTSGGGGTPSH
jgi:hypothetical protein